VPLSSYRSHLCSREFEARTRLLSIRAGNIVHLSRHATTQPMSMLMQLRSAGLLAHRRLDRRLLAPSRVLRREASRVKQSSRSTVPWSAFTDGTVLDDEATASIDAALPPEDNTPGVVNWKSLDLLRVFFRGATMGWAKQRDNVLETVYKRKNSGTSRTAAFYREYTEFMTNTAPKGEPPKPVKLKGLKAKAPNPCPLLNVVRDPNFVDWVLGFIEAQDAFVEGPVAPFFRLCCNDNLIFQLDDMTFQKYNLKIGAFHAGDLTYTVRARAVTLTSPACDSRIGRGRWHPHTSGLAWQHLTSVHDMASEVVCRVGGSAWLHGERRGSRFQVPGLQSQPPVPKPQDGRGFFHLQTDRAQQHEECNTGGGSQQHQLGGPAVTATITAQAAHHLPTSPSQPTHRLTGQQRRQVTDPRELRVICAMVEGNLRLPSTRAKFAAWVEVFNRTYPTLAWVPDEEAIAGTSQVPPPPPSPAADGWQVASSDAILGCSPDVE
jgi:hypothetical protein